MDIVCIGGGPAGLYFALLMKQQDPAHRVRVVERNKPYDTFGWGVVFSDQTLGNLQAADADERGADPRRLQPLGRHRGQHPRREVRLGRPRLLRHRQEAPAQHPAGALRGGRRRAGVRDRRQVAPPTTPTPTSSSPATASTAACAASTPTPTSPTSTCAANRFVWLGTTRLFEAFTFDFQETPHGWFQAHAYRFDATHSTFIVETPEEVWKKAGLDRMEKEEAIAFCEKLFATTLHGHPLLSNSAHLRGSTQWIRFPRVVCERWVHWLDRRGGRAPGAGTPVVLMGDAAHTAHFSIGSGTKLALEDAIELARSIGAAPRRPAGSAAALRGAAQRRGAEDPERGAQLDRVVRACRPLRQPAARAVRLFAADAQPAHQPREPAPARQGVRRGLRGLDRGRCAGVTREPPRALDSADADAVHAARRDAAEPHRRLADGAVLVRRRHARATTTSSTSARARWAAPAWSSPR